MTEQQIADSCIICKSPFNEDEAKRGSFCFTCKPKEGLLLYDINLVKSHLPSLALINPALASSIDRLIRRLHEESNA